MKPSAWGLICEGLTYTYVGFLDSPFFCHLASWEKNLGSFGTGPAIDLVRFLEGMETFIVIAYYEIIWDLCYLVPQHQKININRDFSFVTFPPIRATL